MAKCESCRDDIMGGNDWVSVLPSSVSSHHVHHHLECYMGKVDEVCRTLMIQAAEDQSTVRAVASALDKVRVRIRELTKTTT